MDFFYVLHNRWFTSIDSSFLTLKRFPFSHEQMEIIPNDRSIICWFFFFDRPNVKTIFVFIFASRNNVSSSDDRRPLTPCNSSTQRTEDLRSNSAFNGNHIENLPSRSSPKKSGQKTNKTI